MLRVVVCEGILQDIDHLRALLRSYEASHHLLELDICVFQTGEELLEEEGEDMREGLYLLDAILPGMDGIQVAQALRQAGCSNPIIFLTASRDFAVEAFTVEADNYLLKPVKEDALFPALDAAIARLKLPDTSFFVVQTNDGVERLPVRSILFVEQTQHRFHFHMANGRTVSSKYQRQPFETVLAQLLSLDDFLRPHRSYLVNAGRVVKMTQQDFQMENGAVVPISRLRQKEIRTQYMELLFQIS